MSCATWIASNIVSNCTTTPVAGTEAKAWYFKRTDIASVTFDVTNESMITGLVLKQGKKAATILGVKNLFAPATEAIVATNRPDRYKHKFGLEVFEQTAAAIENGDNLGDIVTIVELKNKTATGNGTFQVFGIRAGLDKATDTWAANDADGSRVISLETREGQSEKDSRNVFFDTDYDTTLAAIVALETPAV